jgi:hypothetical protein
MSRTWEQLVEAGSRAVGACERAVIVFQWELGDLNCEVETVFGADSVARYAAEVGVGYHALPDYGRVAKAYPRYERSPYLSWSAHQVLAAQADRAELGHDSEQAALTVNHPGSPSDRARNGHGVYLGCSLA